MTRRKLITSLCPTAWAICLAAGFGGVGQWVALVPVALVWLAWVFVATSLPATLLVISVLLAGGGLGLGASPFLMLPAAALALASWDVMRWEGFLGDDLPAEARARLERRHYALLLLAVGPALLAGLAGRLVRLPIGFGVVVVLVLVALVALDRLWSVVKGSRDRSR